MQDFIPENNSLILWSDFDNASSVADEILRLMHNKTAYEEKMRWKHFTSIEQAGIGFRQLLGTDVSRRTHTQCQVGHSMKFYFFILDLLRNGITHH